MTTIQIIVEKTELQKFRKQKKEKTWKQILELGLQYNNRNQQ